MPLHDLHQALHLQCLANAAQQRIATYPHLCGGSAELAEQSPKDGVEYVPVFAEVLRYEEHVHVAYLLFREVDSILEPAGDMQPVEALRLPQLIRVGQFVNSADNGVLRTFLATHHRRVLERILAQH